MFLKFIFIIIVFKCSDSNTATNKYKVCQPLTSQFQTEIDLKQIRGFWWEVLHFYYNDGVSCIAYKFTTIGRIYIFYKYEQNSISIYDEDAFYFTPVTPTEYSLQTLYFEYKGSFYFISAQVDHSEKNESFIILYICKGYVYWDTVVLSKNRTISEKTKQEVYKIMASNGLKKTLYTRNNNQSTCLIRGF